MTELIATTIPKLTPHNYYRWRKQMQCVLKQQGLWAVVSGAAPQPAANDPKTADALMQWQEKDEKAYSRIYLHLSDECQEDLADETTAQVAWKRLEDLYGQANTATYCMLLGELMSITMGESETLEAYQGRIHHLHNRMVAIEKGVDFRLAATKLLQGLRPEYKTITTVIFETLQGDQFTFANVLLRLRAEQQRLDKA
jgi:hypothetical protein